MRSHPTVVGVAAALAALLPACGSDPAGAPSASSARQASLKVPNEAMEPALSMNQVVRYDATAYAAREPRPGDVVVFHPPAGARDGACGAHAETNDPASLCARASGPPLAELRALRVVAGPGNRIRFVRGRALVDGVPEARAGILPCDRGQSGCTFRRTVRLGSDAYYLVGDSRAISDDSRFWGPVAREQIVGRITTPAPRP